VTHDLFPPPGGGDPGTTLTCDPNGIGSCVTGLAIKCDDSTDCGAGQVCCGRLFNDGYHSVTCESSCPATMPGGIKGVRFCDPSNPVSECSSLGQLCLPSSKLTGYSVCQ
jgi:hypothetical protein